MASNDGSQMCNLSIVESDTLTIMIQCLKDWMQTLTKRKTN